MAISVRKAEVQSQLSDFCNRCMESTDEHKMKWQPTKTLRGPELKLEKSFNLNLRKSFIDRDLLHRPESKEPRRNLLYNEKVEFLQSIDNEVKNLRDKFNQVGILYKYLDIAFSC